MYVTDVQARAWGVKDVGRLGAVTCHALLLPARARFILASLHPGPPGSSPSTSLMYSTALPGRSPQMVLRVDCSRSKLYEETKKQQKEKRVVFVFPFCFRPQPPYSSS